MSSTIAASLFPSPTSLALFRPSARPFHIVGKSCGAVVPRFQQSHHSYSCVCCRMELLIVMKKTKGGRKIFVPRKGARSETGSKAKRRKRLKAPLGHPRPTEGRNANFLPNSHHGADIAVITRLTKVFPHRRCTSIVRPPVRRPSRP